MQKYENDIYNLENRFNTITGIKKHTVINKYIYYLCVPIIILIILNIWKPSFIYYNNKIDDFLFEKKLDIKKMLFVTFFLSLIIILTIHMLYLYKLKSLFFRQNKIF